MPPSHYKQLLIIPYRKHVLLTGSEVESEQAPKILNIIILLLLIILFYFVIYLFIYLFVYLLIINIFFFWCCLTN